MGNRQSTAEIVSDTVNKSMTNLIMSNSSTCEQNNNSVQTLKIKDIVAKDGCSLTISDIDQNMTISPNFSCTSDSSNEADLLAKFKTQLSQDANATISGFSSAINSSVSTDVKNKIINDITSNINVSNTSKCVQNNIAEQYASFSNITASCPIYCRSPTVAATLCAKNPSVCDFSKCDVKIKDISQNITQTAVADCLSSQANITKVIADVSNDIDQKAISKDEGISVGGIMILLAICFLLFMSSGSSAFIIFM